MCNKTRVKTAPGRINPQSTRLRLPASLQCARACALGALLAFGCRNTDSTQSSKAVASASAAPKPIDRLAPGELEASEANLFGLPVPRGMTVQGKFREFAIATGPLPPQALVQFVRNQVEVERVELGSARTLFPVARIKKAPSDRTFRIEVVSDGPATRLLVRDITPQAPLKIEGLNAEALWRRAGYTRDGKPLNPKALE